MEQLETLAERRDDDLCDIGSISSRDEISRMQMAAFSCQEYAQLYSTYISSTTGHLPPSAGEAPAGRPQPLEEGDAEELLFQTMSDRQKLTEMGKLVGTARYALDGHDATLQQETRRRMERIARLLADKYRGREIVRAAFNPDPRGTRLAELYLSRAFKLLDEEYADIPAIERSIRELQQEQE
ncbi:MAG: hypothetical protein IMW89_02325 [Ktedonobacteraceae bacterium]|nr:hypothetical protein [Ktedonobacteraceae bacterium]